MLALNHLSYVTITITLTLDPAFPLFYAGADMLKDLKDDSAGVDINDELFSHKLIFTDEFMYVLKRQTQVVFSDPMIYLGRYACAVI